MRPTPTDEGPSRETCEIKGEVAPARARSRDRSSRSRCPRHPSDRRREVPCPLFRPRNAIVREQHPRHRVLVERAAPGQAPIRRRCLVLLPQRDARGVGVDHRRERCDTLDDHRHGGEAHIGALVPPAAEQIAQGLRRIPVRPDVARRRRDLARWEDLRQLADARAGELIAQGAHFVVRQIEEELAVPSAHQISDERHSARPRRLRQPRRCRAGIRRQPLEERPGGDPVEVDQVCRGRRCEEIEVLYLVAHAAAERLREEERVRLAIAGVPRQRLVDCRGLTLPAHGDDGRAPGTETHLLQSVAAQVALGGLVVRRGVDDHDVVDLAVTLDVLEPIRHRGVTLVTKEAAREVDDARGELGDLDVEALRGERGGSAPSAEADNQRGSRVRPGGAHEGDEGVGGGDDLAPPCRYRPLYDSVQDEPPEAVALLDARDVTVHRASASTPGGSGGDTGGGAIDDGSRGMVNGGTAPAHAARSEERPCEQVESGRDTRGSHGWVAHCRALPG